MWVSFITRPVCKCILHRSLWRKSKSAQYFLKSKCFSKLFRELANLSALRGYRSFFNFNLKSKSLLHFPNPWGNLSKIRHLWGYLAYLCICCICLVQELNLRKAEIIDLVSFGFWYPFVCNHGTGLGSVHTVV